MHCMWFATPQKGFERHKPHMHTHGHVPSEFIVNDSIANYLLDYHQKPGQALDGKTRLNLQQNCFSVTSIFAFFPHE